MRTYLFLLALVLFVAGMSLPAQAGIVSGTPDDPTLLQDIAVDNETSFAWTGCIIDITMDHTFTLSDAQVITPDDWTAVITPAAWDETEYLGTITCSAGTPVDIGDTLEYSYKVSFTGDTVINESVTPIPEPVTATLLALGGLALIRRRRA
jgi:hypothetical protein